MTSLSRFLGGRPPIDRLHAWDGWLIATNGHHIVAERPASEHELAELEPSHEPVLNVFKQLLARPRPSRVRFGALRSWALEASGYVEHDCDVCQGSYSYQPDYQWIGPPLESGPLVIDRTLLRFAVFPFRCLGDSIAEIGFGPSGFEPMALIVNKDDVRVFIALMPIRPGTGGAGDDPFTELVTPASLGGNA